MSFLSDLVKEINKVRANPASYANIIDDLKQHFQGRVLKLPGTNTGIQTEEGAAAYDECARFLRSAEYAEELTPSKGLTKVAEDLLVIVQKDDSESARVDMNPIIDKYGSYEGSFNRIMECGATTPQQVVINLLVSDGEKSRKNRDLILKDSLKRIGVASGDHAEYTKANIIVLTSTFENKNNADDTETFGDQALDLQNQ